MAMDMGRGVVGGIYRSGEYGNEGVGCVEVAWKVYVNEVRVYCGDKCMVIIVLEFYVC